MPERDKFARHLRLCRGRGWGMNKDGKYLLTDDNPI